MQSTWDNQWDAKTSSGSGAAFQNAPWPTQGFPLEQTNEFDWPDTDATYTNDFDNEEGEGEYEEETLGTYTLSSRDDQNMPITQMSAKAPPGYDGKLSWFMYETQVNGWEDFTVLGKEKRGPALKNRLVGLAYMFKEHLDRTELVKPTGVKYFLDFLRDKFL